MGRPCHGFRRVVCLATRAGSLAGVLQPSARATAQVTARTTGNELRDMMSDASSILVSPLRGDGRAWASAALVGAGFVALLPFDKPVDEWVVRHPNAVVMRALAPFREEHGPLNRLVTARHLVPLSLALVVAGAVTDQRGLREAGLGCIAGWGANNVIRYVTYAAVSRSRPSTGAEPLSFAIPGGSWDEHSFFAGHATNAFACASFWGARFDMGVAEPVIYAGAAMTALSRIADRRHWTSDTFVGIAVGTAIGRLLARRYLDRDEPRDGRVEAAARGTAPVSSNPAAVATHHSRLVRPGPIVIVWRAPF